MRYRTVVVDPPWDHSDGTGISYGKGRREASEGVPYDCLSVSEIAGLPVNDLSDNVGHDAHLYLWATSRYLPDAFTVAKSWGFHYVATLVWCKPSRGFGLGGRYQNNVEFVLFCLRPANEHRPEYVRVTTYLAEARDSAGTTNAAIDKAFGFNGMAAHWTSRNGMQAAVPTVEQWESLRALIGFGHDMDTEVAAINARKGTERVVTQQATATRWFTWPRSEHSAKPEAFLDLVEQVSPGPYLELFARRQRLGWDTWGDEALEHVDLEKSYAPNP